MQYFFFEFGCAIALRDTKSLLVFLHPVIFILFFYGLYAAFDFFLFFSLAFGKTILLSTAISLNCSIAACLADFLINQRTHTFQVKGNRPK